MDKKTETDEIYFINKSLLIKFEVIDWLTDVIYSMIYEIYNVY